MTHEERAKAWFALCDNGNGVVVPLRMNIQKLASEFADVAESEASRLRAALLRHPTDGTCRLCGQSPVDEDLRLCEPCFDELRSTDPQPTEPK